MNKEDLKINEISYRLITAYIVPYMAELNLIKSIVATLINKSAKNYVENKEEIDKLNLKICEQISKHNNLVKNIIKSIKTPEYGLHYITETKFKNLKKQINEFPSILKNKVVSLFDLVLINNVDNKELIEYIKTSICQTIDFNITGIAFYISSEMVCCENKKV